MGPLAVATMVSDGIGESSSKKLHPFFVKGALREPESQNDDTLSADLDTNGQDASLTTIEEDEVRRKRRKTNPPAQDEAGQKKRGRPRGSKGASKGDLGNKTLETVISNKEAVESVANDIPTPPLSDISVIPSEQPLVSDASNPPSTTPAMADSAAPTTPPKNQKILRFNLKTGTLGSPPKPKKPALPSRIVTIKYGHDETTRAETGDKITQILEGKMQLPKTPTKQRASRASKKSSEAASQQSSANKSTHPFFTGKPANKTSSTGKRETAAVHQKDPPARHSVFMSTPVSPRKARVPFTTDKIPSFGSKAGITKVPGAMQPLWPPRDMSHIRGLDLPVEGKQNAYASPSHSRKSKGSIVTISASESVLTHLVHHMDLELVRETLPSDDNSFAPAPKELRIPARHFESGRKLQRRLRPQLRTYKSESSSQDLSGSQDEQKRRNHPAIKQLYDALESQLSAYDRSTCETLAWAQKYAPATAQQVLQAGKEGLLLKEWLETLKVQSVDTGNNDSNGSKGKGKSDTAPRKKRKKNKLDGFIVDSDEEANAMDELSENEDDWTPAGPGLSKKTVIRCGDAASKGNKGPVRLTNAAVVSGPHGSGKTAAVYAIAKELGFEIFEINSSTRRSGKDILEKVGDMTRNHLVQHRAEQPSEENAEDEVSRDLKSGKQGMMTAFFKPKPTDAPKQPPKQAAKSPEEQPATVVKGSSSRSQKQSLILVEEVDVLYEEDKQFWATLMGMITQSKRPFILTCNDESLVPLQSLSLHGIFRFSPPPSDLAVDLCLLIAANEGHALQRAAVESLYRSRNHDLRAVITELNYWCQLGVGDRKGGFDWFYLRWPKGSDLDENGDVVRVISEDTYREGMGWIARDLIATSSNALESEEEALHQSWDPWRVDMGDWHDSLDMDSWASRLPYTTSRTGKKMASTTVYEDFCNAMSDADLCSSGFFGLGNYETLDATVPEMPTKARDDFIIGRNLLEADPEVHAFAPQYAISTSLRSLARNQLFNKASPSSDVTPLEPLTETKTISILDASFRSSPYFMTRMDIAMAFDPIAVKEKAAPSTHLDPSVFDRTLNLIVLDVAPWVRGIVAYDNRLMLERRKLSNLLSEGGKRKRMRNTRAAYSALEGGERKNTRRERYFGDCLTTGFVLRTAGSGWQEAIPCVIQVDESEASVTNSLPSSPPSIVSMDD